MELQIARHLITVGARWRWVGIGAAILFGMQLQIARRLITVGVRLRWVAMGATVLLGNAIADC